MMWHAKKFIFRFICVTFVRVKKSEKYVYNMKRLLLLLVGLLTLSSVSAQKPINLLGKSARYVGAVADKLPAGEGVLTIKNSDDANEYTYTLQGVFADGSVSDATFTMEHQGVTFSGNVGYVVDKKLKCVTLTFADGEFSKDGKSIIALDGDETLAINVPVKGSEISGSASVAVEYDFDAKDIELAKRFAGDDKYTNYGGNITLTASTADGLVATGWERITGGTMTFSNGATVSIDKVGSQWKRANGDAIYMKGDKVTGFSITITEGVISHNGVVSHNNISYKFATGATYSGSYKNLAPTTLEGLIDLKSISWEFNDDVADNIVSGILTYANSSTITFKNSQVADFVVYVKNGCVKIDSVEYAFPNGIKYIGGYDSDFMAIFTPVLLNPEEFVWSTEKFDDYITSGKLYFPNGGPVFDVKQGGMCIISGKHLVVGRASYSNDVYKRCDADGTKVNVCTDKSTYTNNEIINFDNLITRDNVIDYINNGYFNGYGELTTPNGEYFRRENGGSLDCHIIYDRGTIDLKADVYTINHTFENGNKYSGTVQGFDHMLHFKGEDWMWADFASHVFDGELTMANGTRKRYMEGYEESTYRAMIKKWEVEKKKDFRNIDGWSGTIKKYRRTFKDLSYMYYENTGKEDWISFVYKNGDQIDFTNVNGHIADSFYSHFNPEKMMLPSIETDFYKYCKSHNISGPGAYSVFYKNGLRIILNGERVIYPTDKGIVCYEGKKEYDYNVRAYVVSEYYIDYLDYVKDGNTYTENYVKLKNGQHFEGSYRVILDQSKTNPLNDDPRLNNRNIHLCPGPDAITGVEYVKGALFDASGNVVEAYNNGEKLSASETIRLESQYKQQRARREKIERFVAKGYNQNHVESVVDGYIPIGAPIKLLIEYHGSAKIKADGWYDDGHEYKAYKGLGRYIAVDGKGKIVEHSRAY